MEDKINEIIANAKTVYEKEIIVTRYVLEERLNSLAVAEDRKGLSEARIEAENYEYDLNRRLNEDTPELRERHQKIIEQLEKEREAGIQGIVGFNIEAENVRQQLKALDEKINSVLDSMRENPELVKVVDEKILKMYNEEVDKKRKKKKEFHDKKDKYTIFIAIVNSNPALKKEYMKIKRMQTRREGLAKEKAKVEKDIAAKKKELESLTSKDEAEIGKLKEEIRQLEATKREKNGEINRIVEQENKQVTVVVEEFQKVNSELTQDDIWGGIAEGSAIHNGEAVLNPYFISEMNQNDRELEFDEKVAERMDLAIKKRNKDEQEKQAPAEENKIPKGETAQPKKGEEKKKEASTEYKSAGLPAVQELNVFQRLINWIVTKFGFNAPFKAGSESQLMNSVQQAAEKVGKGGSEQEIAQEMMRENTNRSQNIEPLRPAEEPSQGEPEVDEPTEILDANEIHEMLEEQKKNREDQEPTVEPTADEPTQILDSDEIKKLLEQQKQEQEQAKAEPKDDLQIAEFMNKPKDENKRQLEQQEQAKAEPKDDLQIAEFMNKPKNEIKEEKKEKQEKTKANFIDLSKEEKNGEPENKEADDGLSIPGFVNKERPDDDDVER